MEKGNSAKVVIFSPNSGWLKGHYNVYTLSILEVLIKMKIEFDLICGPKFIKFFESKSSFKINKSNLIVYDRENQNSFFAFISNIKFTNKTIYESKGKLFMLDFFPPSLEHLAYPLTLLLQKRLNTTGIIHHAPKVNKEDSFIAKVYNKALIQLLKTLNFRGYKFLSHNFHYSEKVRRKIDINYLNYGVHNREVRREYNYRKKVLFFGGLSEKKGIMTLAKIAKKLEPLDISFTIIGKNVDVDESKLLSVIGESNKIKLDMRFIPEEEISHLFLEHDILALPYPTKWQGSSGPLHLAIEYELPIVTNNAPQLGYLVDKYGIGIVNKDSCTIGFLRSLLRMLYSDKDYSKNFNRAKIENSYYNLVSTLLSN